MKHISSVYIANIKMLPHSAVLGINRNSIKVEPYISYSSLCSKEIVKHYKHSTLLTAKIAMFYIILHMVHLPKHSV